MFLATSSDLTQSDRCVRNPVGGVATAPCEAVCCIAVCNVAVCNVAVCNEALCYVPEVHSYGKLRGCSRYSAKGYLLGSRLLRSQYEKLITQPKINPVISPPKCAKFAIGIFPGLPEISPAKPAINRIATMM